MVTSWASGQVESFLSVGRYSINVFPLQSEKKGGKPPVVIDSRKYLGNGNPSSYSIIALGGTIGFQKFSFPQCVSSALFSTAGASEREENLVSSYCSFCRIVFERGSCLDLMSCLQQIPKRQFSD